MFKVRRIKDGKRQVLMMHQVSRGILIFITLYTCVFSAPSHALGQVLMVDRAYTLLKEGQLEESRDAIDIASEHPSTINDARMWYLRSFIYKEIASLDTGRTNQLLQVSIQSALRSIQADSASLYAKDARAIITYAYTQFLNQAIIALNNQEYEAVLASLQPIIVRKDPLAEQHLPDAFFYYGYALLQLGEKEKARLYFLQALQYGYQDPLIYETQAFHYMNVSQWDSTHWYLNQGKQRFPEDTNLQIAELNFLMQQENYQAAQEVVEKYLVQYPEDVESLLLAGTIYEKLLLMDQEESQYFDTQISVYERVLKTNPDHLQANYNLGIAYYNRAVKLINRAAQNYEMDIMAFNQLLEQCSALFLKALPYVEKVSSLDNTHMNALKALEGIYYNINDYEHYNLVKVKLEKL